MNSRSRSGLNSGFNNQGSPDSESKFIPYGSQLIDDDDIAAVTEVLRSDWLTQGPKVKEFEDKFAEYCGVEYAVSVTSGTAALHLSCIAAGLGKGDEVITSPLTFAASANCALYVGASAAFVDIDPESLCMDPGKLEVYLNENAAVCDPSHQAAPKAVIPVHFAGLTCDMEAVSNIARNNSLTVIEDGCHAHGARYASGERVGSCKYSDMTVFSFHPLKHITTGEGGMVTTNSRELYEKLLLFRSHGITKGISDNAYYQEMRTLGFNYRMNDIQSALGISQLAKLDSFLEKRRVIAGRYSELFKDLDEYIITPPDNSGQHAWHIYVIQLKKNGRDEVFKKLRERGIGVQVHYIPVYLFPYYREIGFKEGLCPLTEKYYYRAITLPIHPSMDSDDVERVVREVRKAVEG